MSTETRWGRALGSPWLAGALAVLELVLGFVLLSFPYILGASAVWVTGFVLLAAGLLHLVHVFTQAGNRWWSLLSAVLFLALGCILLFFPVASMSLLTLFIGVALLAGGIIRLLVAIAMRRETGNAWRVFNGIISIILGGMVLWSWPESSLWLIGTIIAVEMIFSGWALLFMVLTPDVARES